MSKDRVILRFENVSFEHGPNKPILDEVSFPVRMGTKTTIMGQNGAGKSTIFGLIMGTHTPESGVISKEQGLTIAIAKQVMPREYMGKTVREFFEQCFVENGTSKKIYDIDPKIDEVLEVVNLKGHSKLHDKVLKTFSGGQLARILLAGALIQDPDLLLLDEPTNNLDHAGITHLTDFLINYKKTVLVISHDADFLNAFSDGVLYLDIYTKKVEQYVGNYKNVLKEITARVEKENMKNAQLAKTIQAKKDQANVFAHKGGQLRLVAKRMREKAEELEDEMVDVRKEDKTIRNFTIPAQEDINGEIITITSYKTANAKTGKIIGHKANIKLKKNQHLLLKGPNGIGKSTLLESLASGNADPRYAKGSDEARGASILDGIRVGYYRQDFSTLNFDESVFQCLERAMIAGGVPFREEGMRAAAASFLITGDMIRTKIGSLSEGQKGLVAFAKLVLERPGLLILDEPTNHINFRHLPVIAKALDEYKGAMILVSHVPEFVSQIRIDETLDLGATK